MRVHCRYGATETAAAASLTVGSDFSCFVDAHVGPPMAHSTIALRDVGEMNYFVGDASDYATDEAITAKFQSVFPQNPSAQFADSTRSLKTSNERPSDRYFRIIALAWPAEKLLFISSQRSLADRYCAILSALRLRLRR